MRGDEVAIPIETIFRQPFISSPPFIVCVYIDDTVPFLHFATTGTDDVNDAPNEICFYTYTLPHGKLSLFHMALEI